MNTNNFSRQMKLSILILALFVCGCTIAESVTPNPTATSSSKGTVAPTNQISSFESTDIDTVTPEMTEPSPKMTGTPLPILEPTSTISLTVSPVVTATPTLFLTATPFPTIPLAEREMFVMDLLQNNTGCLLPCWWGAIPGQTNWETIRPFLSTFAEEINSYRITNDLVGHGVIANIPEGINLINRIGPFYTIKDGTIESIEVALGNLSNFSISQILTVYGIPTEIWLSTYSDAREGSLPFRLLLFYGEQGFILQYAVEAEKVDNRISGCFVEESPREDPFLFIWNSEIILTFYEVLANAGPVFDEGQFYLPLEEATNMSVEEFQQIFSNSDNRACIETPADLWIGR